jgi:hypothetical protein
MAEREPAAYSSLMNKKGNPRTLVPAYAGNTNAVKSGVHSPRLIEARSSEIEDGLVRAFEFTATQRIAVHELARCMAILEAIDRDLDDRGLVNKNGEARSLLNHRSRTARQLDQWLAKVSSPIDRQTDREKNRRAIGRDDYVRELQRIAFGDDSAATTRDRLTAIERLSELEANDNSVTQVTLNFFRDETGEPSLMTGARPD